MKLPTDVHLFCTIWIRKMHLGSVTSSQLWAQTALNIPKLLQRSQSYAQLSCVLTLVRQHHSNRVKLVCAILLLSVQRWHFENVRVAKDGYGEIDHKRGHLAVGFPGLSAHDSPNSDPKSNVFTISRKAENGWDQKSILKCALRS